MRLYRHSGTHRGLREDGEMEVGLPASLSALSLVRRAHSGAPMRIACTTACCAWGCRIPQLFLQQTRQRDVKAAQ